MENLFYCYKRCSTCKKALKFLNENNVEYKYLEIVEKTPTASQLKEFLDKSNLDIKRFFNTSGQVYRKLNLKDKLDTMSEEEKLELLASDGMLLKRPILVLKDQVLLGFKESEYLEVI